MTMVLVGSQAMLLRKLPIAREPADWDLIATYDETISWARALKPQSFVPANRGAKMIAHRNKVPYEFDIAWIDSSSHKLVDLLTKDTNSSKYHIPKLGMLIVPDLNVLYTLKMSHRFLRNNPYFLKTMADIHHMRSLGAIIPADYKEWFKLREKETYNYKHPNLMQNKSRFFNPDEVKYEYDHDSIHIAMARGKQPAYTYFKKDDEDVAVDKNKWMVMDDGKKLDSVIEEAYVLAIERSQVPYPGILTADESFLLALEKVCTSISSGWWRDWAWENYYKAAASYDKNYMDAFWKAVADGIVKKA